MLPRVAAGRSATSPTRPTWLRPQFARRARDHVRRVRRRLPRARRAPAIAGAARARATAATRCCSARRARSGAPAGALARTPGAARRVHPHAAVHRRPRPRAARRRRRRCAGCAALRAAARDRLRAPSVHAGRLAAADVRAASRATEITHRLGRAGWSGSSTPARGAAGSRAACRSTTPSTASRPTRRTCCSASRSRARPRTSTSPTGSPTATRACAPSRSTSWPTTRSSRGFQSGLRFSDGRPEARLRRLPAAALDDARRASSRLRVYGQVRPLAAGATARVELQNAPLGGGAFTDRRDVHGALGHGRSCARSRASRAASGCAGRRRTGGPPLLSREARRPLADREELG